MTFPEFLEEIDIITEKQGGSGRMSADDYDELKEWMEAGKRH